MCVSIDRDGRARLTQENRGRVGCASMSVGLRTFARRHMRRQHTPVRRARAGRPAQTAGAGVSCVALRSRSPLSLDGPLRTVASPDCLSRSRLSAVARPERRYPRRRPGQQAQVGEDPLRRGVGLQQRNEIAQGQGVGERSASSIGSVPGWRLGCHPGLLLPAECASDRTTPRRQHPRCPPRRAANGRCHAM